MKKNKQEKINLKKLTIARINPVSMGEIKGGSSVLSSEGPAQYDEFGLWIPCYDEK